MKKLFFILLSLNLISFGQTGAEALKKANAFAARVTEIKIGTQTWTSKNLDVTIYRNGEDIPQVQDAAEWENLSTGAWCYYENKTANGSRYGKLYNWYAVKDPRGLAPEGYHIPSDAEWTILTNYLGGEEVVGKKMKSTTGWNSYTSGGIADSYNKTCPNCANWNELYRKQVPCHTCKGTQLVEVIEPEKTHFGNGTNSSGFAGLPGGCRDKNGDFDIVGANGFWWSSLEINSNIAWIGSLNLNNGNFSRGNGNKHYGASVRCVKD